MLLSIITFMNLIKDWLWCQYTPGAGGKLLCAILQLSEKIDAWNDLLRSDFDLFIETKIKIDHDTHMKHEIKFPYDLYWYTRQLPFTRGDQLSIDEAQKLFDTKNGVYDKKLNMPWTKPYFPKWFTGQAITIINDDDGLEFLRRRMDKLFFKWEGNKVYFKRFIPETCTNTKVANTFSDHPVQEKIYEDMNDFYNEQFYKDPTVSGLRTKPNDKRVVCDINLSDFWKLTGFQIATKLNEKFDLEIDVSKADLLVESWIDANKEFI